MDTNARTQKLFLPALIVTTPFLVFLDYNSYCMTCSETLIAFSGLFTFAIICSAVMLLGGNIVSGLIMAVLITVFVDIQFTPRNLSDWINRWAALLLFCGMQTFVLCLILKNKFHNIAIAVFLTFLFVTVFRLDLSSQNKDSLIRHPAPKIHSGPRIIHLILDEHTGIDGIPTDVEGGVGTKELIRRFYLKNGFQVFPGAFARYFRTHSSLASMLNFSAEANPTELLKGHGPYELLQNRYFELLSQKNYRIEVLSPGWLNFCSSSTVAIDVCIEKHWGVLGSFAQLDVPTSQKVHVLYGRYISQSPILAATIYAFVVILQSAFPASATSIGEWIWALNIERTRTDSLNTLADLKPLWNDILSLPYGTVLFAHLSIPHYPYVVLPDCSIRPPNRTFLWNYRNSLSSPMLNTITSRKERYREYFEQLECLYIKLEELFDRMREARLYDDSIILIHSDHGSRITLIDPIAENHNALSNQDLVDGFSTLFAMKIPEKPGGYDPSPWALEELLAKFALEAGLTPNNILPKKTEPYVYLTGNPDKEFVRIPYIPPK